MVVERQITYLTLDDLERRKFDLNDDNEVIVRTTAEGSFVPSGMSSLLYKAFDVTSTEVLLTAGISNRKSMTIYNLSSTDTLFIGNTGVGAHNDVGTVGGIPVFPNSTINLDFAGTINIYGIAETGKTIRVKIAEYA